MAASRLLKSGLADLGVALDGDVADRAEEPRTVRALHVAGAERREPEARMTDVSVRVVHAKRALADLLRLEVAHARPERVGVGSIILVHDRVQAIGSGDGIDRVTEEVGPVQHLARAVVEVDQHDDVR